jgi:tripartite-type tricarboxylate transporter receptor subunit TctC
MGEIAMKSFLLAAWLAAFAATPALAQAPADTYPAKAVKLIVPVPPGGAADVMARMVPESATQAKLKDRGVVPVGSSAQEFARTMNDEHEFYRKLAKDANIKAE